MLHTRLQNRTTSKYMRLVFREAVADMRCTKMEEREEVCSAVIFQILFTILQVRSFGACVAVQKAVKPQ